MEVVRAWSGGVAYPRWVASANYGAGEPRFVFYPPLTWLLGGLLGAVLPWTWTPLAFTLVATLAMAWTFFLMAKEWIAEDNAALAACLYVVNPYMLFVAYERAAYGELLAAVWLPPLLLYGLRKAPALPQVGLLVGLLWLTNAPAAVMGCYALGLVVVWMAIAERRWELLGRAAGGTALGLGVAAFYIVPAVYEQRWVEISRAIGSGMRIEDSFLFEHTGEAFHDQVLHTASWIAVALLVFTAVAAVLSRRRERLPAHGAMLFLAAAITCLLFPFSDVVWRLAPELKFLQFPWRWLLVLGGVAALLAGMCLRGVAETRRAISMRALAVLALACALAAMAWVQFWQPCDDEDNVRAQVATFHDGGFEGTDEYTVAPADNGDVQQGLPPVRVLREASGDEADSSVAENPEWSSGSKDSLPAEVHLDRWEAEDRRATVTTQAPGFAVVRLMDYPAWWVRVNGRRVRARPRREDGLMAIPIGAGRSRIEIRYEATPDVWAGRLISLAAWFLLIALRAIGLWPRERLS